MINTIEIRRGNWIKCPHGYTQVEEIFTNRIHFKDGSGGTSNSVDAILLTPEILENAGFAKDKKFDIYRIGDFAVGQPEETDVWQPLYSSRIIGNELSFVHQVQNLYFFLAGKELIINL